MTGFCRSQKTPRGSPFDLHTNNDLPSHCLLGNCAKFALHIMQMIEDPKCRTAQCGEGDLICLFVSCLAEMRFDPWVGKIPWRQKWQPTPVFLRGEFPGQRSLVSYSPQGQKLRDTTEKLSACAHARAHTQSTGKHSLPSCSPNSCRDSSSRTPPKSHPPSLCRMAGPTLGPRLPSWSPLWPVPQSLACMLDRHRSGLCLAGGHHASKLGGPRLTREALASFSRLSPDGEKSPGSQGGGGEASSLPALKDPVHPCPRRSRPPN